MKYYACNIVLKERSIHLIIFPGYSDYSESNAAIRSHFRLNLTEQRAFQIIVMYSKKIMIWSIMPVILFWKNDLYIWSYFLDIQTILSRMPQSAVISDLIWLSSVHFKSHPCILKNNDLKYYACNIVLKERSIHLIIFPGYSDYSESNAAIRSHFRLNLTEQRAFQIIVMYSKK